MAREVTHDFVSLSNGACLATRGIKAHHALNARQCRAMNAVQGDVGMVTGCDVVMRGTERPVLLSDQLHATC